MRKKRQAGAEHKVDGLDLVLNPSKSAQYMSDQDRARKQAQDSPNI
jgi:hypothetical protein